MRSVSSPVLMHPLRLKTDYGLGMDYVLRKDYSLGTDYGPKDYGAL